MIYKVMCALLVLQPHTLTHVWAENRFMVPAFLIDPEGYPVFDLSRSKYLCKTACLCMLFTEMRCGKLVLKIFKCGFNNIYHNWSKKHCQQHINEFTFRLNEGNVDRDTQDRLDDLLKAMTGKTVIFEGHIS